MFPTYPCVRNSYRRRQGICIVCQQPAMYRLRIQVDTLRRNDEEVKVCDEHKQLDAAALLDIATQRQAMAQKEVFP